ncbi:MAG: 50S ribosomal protein L25 [Anaerolineales bacterium]|nr:50S ribosomal protein L25 [Anaerolineales bacterium]
MADYKLVATRRTVKGKQVSHLRRAGQLPAVVYGPGREPASVQLNAREAGKVLGKVHGAELIDFELDGQVSKVLVHDLQRNSIRGEFVHVDLYAVDMNRTIRVRIPIRLLGTSPAVTTHSAVLVRGNSDLEVECLPGDLITQVEADLGVLLEIGQAIHVGDLKLPANIKVLTDPEELVVRATYQAKEEDLSTPTTAAAAEVEVIEKGKTEEEGEEGAAPAKGGAPAKAAPAAKK